MVIEQRFCVSFFVQTGRSFVFKGLSGFAFILVIAWEDWLYVF